MAFGHLLMFLSYNYHWRPALTLVAMLVPTGAFTLTLAPLSWVVLSEIYPNRVRGKAMSLATGAMFTCSFITIYLFDWMLGQFKKHFGHEGGAFLIFLGICLAGACFIWLTVPETKDRTLEEIGELWLRKDRAPQSNDL
jgi:MFS family permease